jgi:hypothetical protein
MSRRLLVGISPFVLLAIASCGSSSGGDSNPDGGVTNPGEDGGSSSGDDATSGSSSGGGTSSGGSSSGTGSSGGSGSGGLDASSSGGGGEAGVTASDADVLMLHKHINRDGLFVDSALTKAALMGKTLKLDATFAGTLSGNMFASPLYVANGVGGKGTFYVVTESNNVYALDETTGANAVPSRSAGPPAGSTGCAPWNIKPSLGITGTPAIDLASRVIVFDAATAASAGGALTKHTIHAWSIDDLSEKWSFDVTTLKDPSSVAFPASLENQRSAILIVGGVAYVTYAGHYGDCGAYRGWVVGVPVAATQATVASMVKSYVVPAMQSGMWAPGGPSSDGTSIFVATGNGSNGATWMGAFSVIRLGAGPSFTAGANNYWHAVMDSGDEDLGGSGPLVVDAPGITPSKLIVQLGKDHHAYAIDRTTMGGEASPVASAAVSSGELSNAAAWATTPTGTYVATMSNGGAAASGCVKGSGNLGILQLSATAQITVPWCVSAGGNGSPSITSSDGTNDMLVWAVGTEGSNQLHAWDLATGAPVVTGSDAMAGARHFTTPIFVHGRAFAVGDNRLYALKP